MIMEQEFLHALSDALQDRLVQKLDLMSSRASERCVLYLAEDPKVTATREELFVKKRLLEKVKAELTEIFDKQ